MVRKIVLSLVVVTLVLTSPVMGMAQDGPSLPEAPFVADGGPDGPEGPQRMTARHGSNADPDGVESPGLAEVDLLSALTRWVQAFWSSAPSF